MFDVQLNLFDSTPDSLIPKSFYSSIAVGDRVEALHCGVMKPGTVVQSNKANIVIRFDNDCIRQYPRSNLAKVKVKPTDVLPPVIPLLPFQVGDRVISRKYPQTAIPATVVTVLQGGEEVKVKFDSGGSGTYNAREFIYLKDADMENNDVKASLETFVGAWHPNASLTQGTHCKIIEVDQEFPEHVKVEFDVVMLDTTKTGLLYRSKTRSIWVDLSNFAPICPLTCGIKDDSH